MSHGSTAVIPAFYSSPADQPGPGSVSRRVDPRPRSLMPRLIETLCPVSSGIHFLYRRVDSLALGSHLGALLFLIWTLEAAGVRSYRAIESGLL